MDLPFLYQTRTILRGSSRSPSRWTTPLVRQARCIHQEVEHPASRSVDVQRWATARSFFRVKAEEMAATKPAPPASTITRDEQRAFNSLLRLAKQQQQEHGSQIVTSEHSPEADRLNTNPVAILNLFLPASSNDQDRDLVAFICRDRVQHISKLFNDALQSTTESGELALWKVLQTHVFPLSEVLKPSPEIPRKSLSKVNQLLEIRNLTQLYRKEHQQQQSATPASPPSTSTTSAPLPTPLTILTPLYPTTLLLALRLLTIHYPLSPLSHSLLSHITHLGPSSYVLAASTPFYNTHLFLRWECFSSLSEICDLLGEMERGGVDFDRGTLRMLRWLAEERDRDLRDDGDGGGGEESLGRRGAEWWMKAEQVRWWRVVEEWIGGIAKRLELRGLGEVVREGPEGMMNANLTSKVWL